MEKLSSVIFDVDGVLLDSLTPHLQICKDKNLEYGLGLSIPNPNNFKKMVRQGVKISPMKYFFEAVGFPSEYAEKAFAQYKEIFTRVYAPNPFPQVGEMLSKLATAGLTLGIVTSNVRSNVDAALGQCMRFFHPECILTEDSTVSMPKADKLLLAAKKLHVEPIETIYVGDQPADWIAAKVARINFLGVTYGWGISEEDNEFPLVTNVMGVAEYILHKVAFPLQPKVGRAIP